MKRKATISAAIVFSLCFTSLLAGAWFFSSLVVRPRVWDYDASLRSEIGNHRFTEAWYRSLPREEHGIDSPHGYRLHALWIPAPTPSTKTIVFVHGHTFTLMGDYKYLPLFRSRGFNALFFDSRYHGKSGGQNVTFGKYEREDVQACIDWVQQKTGSRAVIGVHGESMGAAVCMLHGAAYPGVAFYVLDGAMTDLSELLAYRLKRDFGLPRIPLVPAASLVSRLRGAMFFEEISPIRLASHITSPVFFVHGGSDAEIPPEQSLRLYQRHAGIKRRWVCPGAGHSKSIIVDPAGYERELSLFFRDIGLR